MGKIRHSSVCNSIQVNCPSWSEIELLCLTLLSEDSVNTVGPVLFATYSGAQRQVTLKSIYQCGRSSKVSEVLCLAWLPASLIKIRTSVSTAFSLLYKPMEKVLALKGQ